VDIVWRDKNVMMDKTLAREGFLENLRGSQSYKNKL
jgi:hypothetical protein